MPSIGDFTFTLPEEYYTANNYASLQLIVSEIERARTEITVFSYGLDERHIITALVDAKRRGVSVKIVGSKDEDYSAAQAEGLALALRAKSGLQHAKLIFIDGVVLIGGTGNLTESDLFHNNNAFFRLLLNTETYKTAQNAFLLEDEEHPVHLAIPFSGRLLASPKHGSLIQSIIVQKILSARQSIQFMIFSHTDAVISAALYLKASQGILVEGIYDDDGNDMQLGVTSEAARLLQAFVWPTSRLYLDGNRSVFEKKPGQRHGGKLHHKTIIVDGHTVITGSYNWSLGARDSNLESVFIFEDPLAAAIFNEEFQRVRSFALPLAPDTQSEVLPMSEARVSVAGSQVCADYTDFTLFSGQGTFFRAERFHRAASAPSCIPLKMQESISAGLGRGSQFLLPPDLDAGFTARAEADLHFIRHSPAIQTMPCDVERCEDLRTQYVNLESGIFWLQGNENLQSLVLWNRDGVQAFPLNVLAPDYYTTTPQPASDALVFLRDTSGLYKILCIQYGSVLEKRLNNWLDAYEWLHGSRPVCVNGR